jgi:ankyrin repeat protein
MRGVVEQVGAKKYKHFMAAEEEAVMPLFVAVHDDDVAEVGRLLDEDARLVEARVEKGHTPLLLAVGQGHVGMVRLLLGRGADIEARNDQGFAPLHYSLFSSSNAEVVEVLLDWGADANKTGPLAITPLMLASSQGKMGAVKRLWRALEGQGLNAQADTGATAFWVACNKGHADIARLLLLEGADHTVGGEDGTPAREAAEAKGHEECVALIQVRTHMTLSEIRVCVCV